MELTTDRGLYVHIPFCKSRCHFCAFYLEIYHPAAAASFVKALSREIALCQSQRIFTDRPVTSVYFGGGTPTMLTVGELDVLLKSIRQTFRLDPAAEITIEAHPDSVSQPYLDRLIELGFNRISFGAESMETPELVRVGRPTDACSTMQAVQTAIRAGFTNINLDLIFGLPGQTTSTWLRTLQMALALGPTHLSCYALTLEEGTRLVSAVRRGDMHLPDWDLQNEMEDIAEQELLRAAFRRYEISNYARAGSRCRHNLLYWTGGMYLGLGPSAQSLLDGMRHGNVADLATYANMLNTGILPRAESERLSPQQLAREAVVFGLRKTDGIPTTLLPLAQTDDWVASLGRLIDDRYLERSDQSLKFTPRGRRYADHVCMQLL